MTSTEETNLLQYLCQRSKVLVVGDVLLERLIHTTSKKNVSLESAIVKEQVSQRLGACGNVALNLQKLGMEVSLMAPVNPKGQIHKLLVENGLSTEALLSCSHQDPLETRYISPDHHHLPYQVSNHTLKVVLDDEALESLAEQMHVYLKKNLPDFDCLIISDFEGDLLSKEVAQSIIQSARNVSIPVLVDPKMGQYEKFRGTTLMKLHLEDAPRFCCFPVDDDDSKLLHGLQKARKELQIEECVITSKDGLLLCQEDKQVATENCKNTSAFEDAAIMACLAFGKANRLSLLESSQLANHATQSIDSSKPDTAPLINLAKVLKHYSKVVTSPQQERFLGETLRKHQEKVVFVSGCFDIMHRGHINILRRAKERGDVLVVGLNSDSSVRLNKGEQRPICLLVDRLAVLKCIHYCDFIVVFDESTPAKILDTLRPDLLVKGDDHPESHARAMFPRMENFAILPRTPDISTTDLIGKMSQL